MTTITWEQLTKDEREALQSVKEYDQHVDDSPQLFKTFIRLEKQGLVDCCIDEVKGLYSEFNASITDAGREVLAQKPPATEKTVKLKTRSADGLYWEVLYTDGTWAGEEVSHE